MKIRPLLLLLLLPGFLTAANPSGQKAAAASAINQLSWLAGKWRLEKAGKVIDEQWMSPAAGVMLGMSRTLLRGKVSEHEFMQIREGPGGTLYFIAQPSGQKEAAFQLKSLGPNSIMFENSQLDFPQQIFYTLQPDGTLLAALQGPGGADGKDRVIEYVYQRSQP
jgi:hypothetical protein